MSADEMITLEPVRKTVKMLEAEEVLGGPLEDTLANLVTAHGLKKSSDRLGIGVSLLRAWLHRFGIATQYIALAPADEMEITRNKVIGPIEVPADRKLTSRR